VVTVGGDVPGEHWQADVPVPADAERACGLGRRVRGELVGKLRECRVAGLCERLAERGVVDPAVPGVGDFVTRDFGALRAFHGCVGFDVAGVEQGQSGDHFERRTRGDAGPECEVAGSRFEGVTDGTNLPTRRVDGDEGCFLVGLGQCLVRRVLHFGIDGSGYGRALLRGAVEQFFVRVVVVLYSYVHRGAAAKSRVVLFLQAAVARGVTGGEFVVAVGDVFLGGGV